MSFYSRAITSPWFHLICGLTMIFLAAGTVWESLDEAVDIHTVAITASVILLGVLVLIEALSLFLEGVETAAEGVEYLSWSLPRWVGHVCWVIVHNPVILTMTAGLLLLMGAVDAIHVALEDHYEALPTALGLGILAISMASKAVLAFYESLFFAREYSLKIPSAPTLFLLTNPWIQVATGAVVVFASLWEEGIMAATHVQGAWRDADWGLAVYGTFLFLRFIPKVWGGVVLFAHPKSVLEERPDERK